MRQQSALHNPFPRTGGSKSRAGLERRRYNSKERDARLYGTNVAARLQEAQYSNPLCASDDSVEYYAQDPSASQQCSATHPPTPVLDAVLLSADDAQLCGRHSELLAELQGTVSRYLRHPHTGASKGSGIDAAVRDTSCAQAAMEDSFVAVRPRSTSTASSGADATASPGPNALFLLPTRAALRSGAWTLAAAAPDALRVHECLTATELWTTTPVTTQTTPSASVAVGVVVRLGSENARSSEKKPLDEVPLEVRNDDKVFWLCDTSLDGVTHCGREFCLAVYSANSSSAGGDQAEPQHDKNIVVHAVPCQLSLRTYPLQPKHTVTAFVQHPPRDAACTVQPFSATYTVPPARNALDASDDTSSLHRRHVGPGLSVAACGVRSPSAKRVASTHGAQTRSTVVTAASALLHDAGAALCGFYYAVWQVLHYLVFPASTYYIQYYQADYRVTSSSASTAAAQSSTATQGKARSTTVNAHWELLVVVGKPSTRATGSATNDVRAVARLPLEAAPTNCDALLISERSGKGETSTAAFPSCVVSLTAAHPSAGRVLTVQRMTLQPVSDGSGGRMAGDCMPGATSNRARKGSMAAEKRHMLELSTQSFELLNQRAVLQRRLRFVRGVLRALGLVVVAALALLIVLLLVVDDTVPEQAVKPNARIVVPEACSVPDSTEALPTHLLDPLSLGSEHSSMQLRDQQPCCYELDDSAEDGSCVLRCADSYALSCASALAPALEACLDSGPPSEPEGDAVDLGPVFNSVEHTAGGAVSDGAGDRDVANIAAVDEGADRQPTVVCDGYIGGAAAHTHAVPFTSAAPSVHSTGAVPQQEKHQRAGRHPYRSEEAAILSGSALHHLLTQYQEHQQRQRSAADLPNVSIRGGGDILRERLRALLEVLTAQFHTHSVVLGGLALLLSQHLLLLGQITKGQARQLVAHILQVSQAWADALAKAVQRYAPWLKDAWESEIARYVREEVTQRARLLKRAVRKASATAQNHIQAAWSAAKVYIACHAFPLVQVALGKVNVSLLQLGGQWSAAQEHMCAWQDRAAADTKAAVDRLLRVLASAVAVVFGSV
jgi:hypothetical protein